MEFILYSMVVGGLIAIFICMVAMLYCVLKLQEILSKSCKTNDNEEDKKRDDIGKIQDEVNRIQNGRWL